MQEIRGRLECGTFGGLKGYSAGKTISILKAPPLYGGSCWRYIIYRGKN